MVHCIGASYFLVNKTNGQVKYQFILIFFSYKPTVAKHSEATLNALNKELKHTLWLILGSIMRVKSMS